MSAWRVRCMGPLAGVCGAIYFACGSGSDARQNRGRNSLRGWRWWRRVRDPSTAQVLAPSAQALAPLRMTTSI